MSMTAGLLTAKASSTTATAGLASTAAPITVTVEETVVSGATQNSHGLIFNQNTGVWDAQREGAQAGVPGAALVSEPTVEALLRDESVSVRAVVIAMANMAGMDPVQLYQAAQTWQGATI